MKAICLSWIPLLLAILIEPSVAIGGNTTGKNENEYDVKKIPPALLKDADAVIRTDLMQFEVKNERRAKLKVKFAATIFKKEKRDYGYLVLWYDKFYKIEELEGTIYDANGEKIRELGSDEIKDYSGTDGFSLVIDARAHVAEFYHDQYPYTIVYSYEYSTNGYLNWPVWLSQGTLDPIEENRFEVIIPKEDTLRYWCNNDTIKPAISIQGGKKIYVWESKNLPKLSKDVVGEDAEDVATIVRIAPSHFEIGDYPGDMRTWKEFGKWDYSLSKDRDILPEPAIQDIHSLLQPADDTKTKIKKLYRYMQDRTRYVSVQLGIGGWQPFEAKYVHERSYGDCKALSNYMVALLKEAGIVAYSFLIRAGSYRLPFINEFPSNQFNHAMVCVPLQNDTIWLECTSQSMPFGHISHSTENRGALLITPDGGVVVHTPSTSPQQNMQRRHATVALTSFGNAYASSIVARTGDQQDYIREALSEATPEERERWVTNHLGIPNADLKNFEINGLETHDMEISLSIRLALPHYASASGDRLFFQPNLMERRTNIPPDITQRLSPIRYDYPYLDIDSICYTLPNGFTIESLPAEVNLESSFGRFASKTIAVGDTAIIYTRSLEIREYSIQANNYVEYRKFFADIVKVDRAQVVLARKN